MTNVHRFGYLFVFPELLNAILHTLSSVTAITFWVMRSALCKSIFARVSVWQYLYGKVRHLPYTNQSLTQFFCVTQISITFNLWLWKTQMKMQNLGSHEKLNVLKLASIFNNRQNVNLKSKLDFRKENEVQHSVKPFGQLLLF